MDDLVKGGQGRTSGELIGDSVILCITIVSLIVIVLTIVGGVI